MLGLFQAKSQDFHMTPVSLEVINPRRACAARVTVVVPSVCVCVDAYSGTIGYEAAH